MRARPSPAIEFLPDRRVPAAKEGIDIRTFRTIMTLGTPQDVTLQELRVETFFPADEASDHVLRTMAAYARG